MDRLTRSWETKTWLKEEMSWKKLSEQLICLNRCLYPVTQSPDLKHSITKWESMCSRSSTQLTCAPRPLMPPVRELCTFKYGLRESPTAVLHHSTHVYKPSCATGHVGLAGPDFVWYDRGSHDRGVFSSILIENGCDDLTCWIGNTRTNQQIGTTR